MALVAPGVENAGVIRAELGRVVLASGNAFTLDLYGDKLVRLVVDDQALDRLTDIDGKPLRSLVANSGRIEADGGQVLLATAAAKAVLDSAVNMSGVILARSFEQRPGEIVLAAGSGTTSVSGSLDASGRGEGETRRQRSSAGREHRTCGHEPHRRIGGGRWRDGARRGRLAGGRGDAARGQHHGRSRIQDQCRCDHER